ncbi:MAG: hypothetical protein RL653_1399 [Pseudomonadota bacterium]
MAVPREPRLHGLLGGSVPAVAREHLPAREEHRDVVPVAKPRRRVLAQQITDLDGNPARSRERRESLAERAAQTTARRDVQQERREAGRHRALATWVAGRPASTRRMASRATVGARTCHSSPLTTTAATATRGLSRGANPTNHE